MKLKNIFVTISVAGMLFSCVAEDIADTTPAVEGEDIVLNLSLKMAEVQTKAGSDVASNYTYATNDELEVSDCVVAVFRLDTDGTPGAMIGTPVAISIAGGGMDSLNIRHENKKAYLLKEVPAKTGDVRILVIANPPADYTALTTYTAFEEAAVSTAFTKPSEFDAKKLIKTGYVDLKGTGKLTPQNYTSEIVVPMTQLAARIDLNITLNMDPDTLGRPTAELPMGVSRVFNEIHKSSSGFSLNNQNDRPSAPNLTVPEVGSFYVWKCQLNQGNNGQCEVNHVYKNDLHYWNPNLNGNTGGYQTITAFMAHVEGDMTIDSVTYINQWTLLIDQISVNNIQTQTHLIIPGTAIALHTPGDWAETFDEAHGRISTAFHLTFYTYEKPLYGSVENPENDHAEALSIRIDGKFEKGTVRYYETYAITGMHGIWISTHTLNQESGWGNGIDSKFVPVEITISSDPIPGSGFTEDAGTQTIPGSFEIRVNPKETDPDCDTNGFKAGNLYWLDVIFQSVIHEPLLDYRVVEWNEKSKDIPPFE